MGPIRASLADPRGQPKKARLGRIEDLRISSPDHPEVQTPVLAVDQQLCSLHPNGGVEHLPWLGRSEGDHVLAGRKADFEGAVVAERDSVLARARLGSIGPLHGQINAHSLVDRGTEFSQGHRFARYAVDQAAANHRTANESKIGRLGRFSGNGLDRVDRGGGPVGRDRPDVVLFATQAYEAVSALFVGDTLLVIALFDADNPDPNAGSRFIRFGVDDASLQRCAEAERETNFAGDFDCKRCHW